MDKILVTGSLQVLKAAIEMYGADRVWWQTSSVNERVGIRAGMLRGNLLALDREIDESEYLAVLSELPDWEAPLEEGVSDEEE